MTERRDPDSLIDFPCFYEFKAFGEAGDDFPNAVLASVATLIPVSRDAMKIRNSSGGRYQCVTLVAELHNSEQLKSIYAVLRQVDGIRYIL
jgi:putative lipoic acid-binding regulatory protein